LLFAFLMDMMVRGLNILVQDWSASFRYYFPYGTVKTQLYYLNAISMRT
jgi:hypothetical protein